ncbi:HNH endonuclease [Aliivibrio fischeri]|uniref:HNH endonuclease n=1 Tax=Aliivibrio fischeri TaxID=668 RepID=UPI00084CCF56|nr:HNH endonuclease [Aliivibrio fischeri]MUH97713.1 HNH endonuclease [Aliivibrio fischeri]MUI62384.1 HNH endonuclease [Aliivibrio fischeri]OED54918.1 restriction endonuclease [Aliivibrio fischeri]
MSVEYYVDKFRNLNMNSNKGRKSPHKVCMLLSVMDLIQAGYIYKNRFQLDATLKERFTHFFNERRHEQDRDTPENPFFHLKSEGFWHLAYQDGIDASLVKGYSAKAINYAYLDDELFDYLKSVIVVNDLKDALVENLSDLTDLYTQWLIDVGKSEKTAKNYSQAIRGSISNWMIQENILKEPLTKVKSFREFCRLSETARSLEKFKKFNANGNHMYSAALNSYQRFLADLSQVDVKADIQEIFEDNKLTQTEKTIMVNTRMGQGTFRKQLIEMWKGCSVTGYKNTQMLVASHIKPWREANNTERLDKYNGLLLLANLDKAFDLGFISFQNSGKLMISSQLEAPEVLGLRDDMIFNVHREHKKYLDHHRKILFKGF